MNLRINGIEAIKDADKTRELAIKSRRAETDQVLVSVNDSSVRLPPQQAEQIFNAFFTAKPHGTGLGLRIRRSIIESHGGRLCGLGASPRGASFHFALLTKNRGEGSEFYGSVPEAPLPDEMEKLLDLLLFTPERSIVL